MDQEGENLCARPSSVTHWLFVLANYCPSQGIRSLSYRDGTIAAVL